MKRITLSFLLFLIVVGSAYAISGTTSFKINAYKVGTYDEPHITMEAYDALEANLTTIKSGNQLDLSHYTSNLKNNSEDTSYSVEPYDRHVIFSFHVDGNYNGSFKLSVSIGPLVHSNSDGTVKDSSHIITAYYEMRDTSCVFTSTYKSTGEKGGKASTPTLSPSNITLSIINTSVLLITTTPITIRKISIINNLFSILFLLAFKIYLFVIFFIFLPIYFLYYHKILD